MHVTLRLKVKLHASISPRCLGMRPEKLPVINLTCY